jgi:hypothetical protein
MIRNLPLMTSAALAFALSACGGGGGGVNSMPTPTPSPTPTPTPTPTGSLVTIFQNPSPGTYSSVGASISGSGGNLDTYPSASSRFGPVSNAAADQPQIRYTSSGTYEIEMPAAAWDILVPYRGLSNPGPDNNYFQPGSVQENSGFLATSNARLNGYSYSEMASWGSAAAGRGGYVAFGVPTPAGGIPSTGSASFSGTVSGSADVMTADNLAGGFDSAAVNGSVTLNFDFAKGTLGGSMDASLSNGGASVSLGTFTFADTVYSSGSTTYSGKFDSSAAGDNFFTGRFTGPSAQETIGAWALPFVFKNGASLMPADNEIHQAFGAWIAKSHP